MDQEQTSLNTAESFYDLDKRTEKKLRDGFTILAREYFETISAGGNVPDSKEAMMAKVRSKVINTAVKALIKTKGNQVVMDSLKFDFIIPILEQKGRGGLVAKLIEDIPAEVATKLAQTLLSDKK